MSTCRFRGTPRSLAVMAIIAALGAGAIWERTGAIGDEPRKPVNQAAIDHAEALSDAFHNAAEIALPSVVTIHSTTKPRQVANNGRGGRRTPSPQGNNNRDRNRDNAPPADNPFKGTPLEDFFGGGGGGLGDMEEYFRQMPQQPRGGVGSGVIIDRSGIVLTNNHVVAGADEVMVKLADGREFKGEDIKTDEHTDLAVIRIRGAGTLPAATIGNSDRLRVGDWVIAIGSPFEKEQSVSAGIISGLGRDLQGGGAARRTAYLQTDAAINPGNSGGPLINLHGEVVGINTAIATTTGAFNGLGFAIPSNLAKWVMGQLINQGTVQRAYLGVNIKDLSTDLATKFGTRMGDGVLVEEVRPDTPAAAAGFKDGDVITKFAGQKVKNSRELIELVERTPVDSKQSVEVLRDGRTANLTVVLKELPGETMRGGRATQMRPESREETTDYADKNLGITVANMSTRRAEELGFKGHAGVMVTGVTQNMPGAEYGLQEGMLITQVGKTPVTNVEDFASAMKHESLKEGVMMAVRDASGKHFVVIKE